MDSTQTRLWGDSMAATMLYCSFLKGEERVIADLTLPATPEQENSTTCNAIRLRAEAIQVGEVRGYAQYSQVPVVEGDSTLQVQKVLYNATAPYSSIIPACRELGSCGSDMRVQSSWQTFFDNSEQVRTALQLRTHVQASSSADQGSTKVLFSGGIVVQALPDSQVMANSAGASLKEGALAVISAEEEVEAISTRLSALDTYQVLSVGLLSFPDLSHHKICIDTETDGEDHDPRGH